MTAKPIAWSNSPLTHGFYTAVTPQISVALQLGKCRVCKSRFRPIASIHKMDQISSHGIMVQSSSKGTRFYSQLILLMDYSCLKYKHNRASLADCWDTTVQKRPRLKTFHSLKIPSSWDGSLMNQWHFQAPVQYSSQKEMNDICTCPSLTFSVKR